MGRLIALSAAWARVELALAATCAGAITVLILVNIVTRAMGEAVYWIDEAAIYTMIWMALLAASAAFAKRDAIAVNLIYEVVGPGVARLVNVFVDAAVALFGVLMMWLCLLWFDPVALLAAGFDTAAFQADTFNFIYAEPTLTLDIAKAWVWLAVPVFALGATLHASANLMEAMRGVPRVDPAGTAER